jgi:iron(III) transport system ATP-binding protein
VRDNAIEAKVLRQVFLGSSRDYMVEVANGTQFRIVTPPAVSVAPGSMVWLRLPPERCRALLG